MTVLQQPQHSLRPTSDQGSLARRWRSLLKQVDPDYEDRLTRGKTLARGGRVRHLSLSPGLATAEVHDGGVHRATLRMRTLDSEAWDGVVQALLADLTWPATLLEGDLPRGLVQTLDAIDVRLMPRTHDELDGDCDCGDYALPCAHVAAIHHVLAEAIDGDAFVLFTLRGRPREQLLTTLRRAWGDTSPTLAPLPDEEVPDPDLDWFHAPTPVPNMQFHLGAAPEAIGLVELGPLLGDDGLERALQPLFAAGREAALELALAESTPGPRRRRRAQAPTLQPAEPAVPKSQKKSRSANKAEKAEKTEKAEEAETADDESPPLTERLVDLLAESDEGTKSRDLAEALEVTVQDLRAELIELETLGIVYRTGATRGTRWWLG